MEQPTLPAGKPVLISMALPTDSKQQYLKIEGYPDTYVTTITSATNHLYLITTIIYHLSYAARYTTTINQNAAQLEARIEDRRM